MPRHACNIALFALAQVAEMGSSSMSLKKEILILDFFQDDAQQFWWLNLLCKHLTILV